MYQPLMTWRNRPLLSRRSRCVRVSWEDRMATRLDPAGYSKQPRTAPVFLKDLPLQGSLWVYRLDYYSVIVSSRI